MRLNVDLYQILINLSILEDFSKIFSSEFKNNFSNSENGKRSLASCNAHEYIAEFTLLSEINWFFLQNNRLILLEYIQSIDFHKQPIIFTLQQKLSQIVLRK